MAEQHRAKPYVWAAVEKLGKNDLDMLNCVLELRARVEALEAAQPPKPNHPGILGGSLKERIKSRMIETVGSTWEETAASVLVEVAAWLREHYGGPTATTDLLEQEAER